MNHYQTLLAQDGLSEALVSESPRWMTWLAENSTWLAQGSVNFLLQSTALILVGLIAARLLKKQGSAIQSAIYRATLVAVIACPLAAIGLGYYGFSGWTFELPETTTTVSIAATESGSSVSIRDESASVFELSQHKNPQVVTPEVGIAGSKNANLPTAEFVMAQFPAESQPPWSSTAGDIADAETAAAPAMVQQEVTNSFLVICYLVVGVLWLMGSLFLLAKLVLAFMALQKLRRQSLSAASDDVELCRQIADRIKVLPPDVRRNSLLSSPCLTGIAAPTILLPTEIENRVPLEKAFAHELAHLRRRDTLWNLIQRTALAIFFFQPLLWRLVYRLETSAEEVCDDFVVRHCMDRTGYAQQLVELAESNLLAPEMAHLEMASLRMFSRKTMLGSRVGRILDTTRKLTTSVSGPVVATIATLTLSAAMLSGLIGNSSPNLPEPPPAPATESPAKPDGSLVKVSGRVLDPDGKPVGGAKLTVMARDDNQSFIWQRSAPCAEAVSDSDGTYKISFGNAALQKNRNFVVVASKSGHGLGWAESKKPKATDLSAGKVEYRDTDIALVNSETPLRLKIVDTEGNPVPGAAVKVRNIYTYKNNDFGPILENANKKLHFREAVVKYMDRILGLPGLPDYQTDNQGNVTIAGLGDQRTVEIEVIGDSVCSTISRHMTVDHTTITFDYGGMPDYPIELHGATATITCEPTQPIVGKIVDRKTQQPLAGVDIFSDLFAGEKMSGTHRVKTKSKSDGTFRLMGMPKGPGNEIVIVPNDDQPYFMITKIVPPGSGLAPVELKIELDKGIWIRGKAIDKNTKESIVGARLFFLPFLSNKIAAALPSAADGLNFGTASIQDRYTTAADGSFQLLGVPGKSVIGLLEVNGIYPSGAGFETIDADEIDQKRDHAKTFHNPIKPSKKWPTVMRQIELAADAKQLNLDFELDAGLSFPLQIVDDSGKPLTGVTISRLRSNMDYDYQSTDSNVVAGGFSPDEQRTIRFVHEDKRLALIVQMDAAKADPDQSRTIQLQPYATIKGRLVDNDGDPVAGGKVRFTVGGSQDFALELSERTTNDNGEFIHQEVCVGTHYSVGVELANDFRLVAKKLEVSRSQEIDLGTVNIYKTDDQESPDPAGSVQNSISTDNSIGDKQADDSVLRLSGTVVDLAGNPVADAQVRFQTWKDYPALGHQAIEQTKTGSYGEFKLSVSQSFIDSKNFAPEGDDQAAIVITAKGFGSRALLWTDKKYQATFKNSEPFSISLEPEHVIVGRIVNLEGRPVAGAQIEVTSTKSLGSELADKWLADLGETKSYSKSSRLKWSNDSELLYWTYGAYRHLLATDDRGEFTTEGLPADAIVHFQVEHPELTTQMFEVLNRAMEANKSDPAYTVHGDRPVIVAQPGRPIVGKVIDSRTGDPIPGVKVYCKRMGIADMVFSTSAAPQTHTDEDGNFELLGMPKSNRSRLMIYPPKDLPYLIQEVNAIPDYWLISGAMAN